MKELANETAEDSTHPREKVDDTLRSLIPFCDHLIAISEAAASIAAAEAMRGELERLTEGLDTMRETVDTARKILGVGPVKHVEALEKELASILQDIDQTMYSNDLTYRTDLLQRHVQRNLSEWRDRAIPALMRSRDN